MPLQIRRGTNAERQAMAQPLAPGELLYVTDDQKLYVGNGSTLGGIQITGYTNEDAVDAAGAALVAGSHSGITFTYGLTQDTANRIDATVDLSNYIGTIKADAFKGTFVGDDSTILVDGVSGTLRGSLIGNVTGNVAGNVTGNISGNVVGSVTGNVTGNLTGNVIGDVKGSVFADDSSILVDAVDRIFYGTVDLGVTVLTTDSLVGTTFNIGTTSSALQNLVLNLNNNLQVRHVADPVNGKFITTTLGRGTLASPAAIQAGDELGGVLIRAYTDGSNTGFAGAFGFVVDSTAVISGGSFVKSKAVISASSDSSADLANAVIIDSTGTVTSNGFVASKFMQLPVYADDSARSAAIPTPAKGMMVFMTSGTSPVVTNKPVIFNGSIWEAF